MGQEARQRCTGAFSRLPARRYCPPLGITFAEFLNTDESSNRKSFLLALDLEKVSHAGFTGEDMGGGRQLLIDVKRCGDNVDHPDRVHVLLIHETAMSVTESGVMVSM